MRIGAHISIAGGAGKTVERAETAGCEAIQIFSGNPRGWKVRKIGSKDAAELKKLCRRRHIQPIVIHSPYLINLSASDPEIYRKSLAAFERDLKRADLFKADYFVIHVGYHRGLGVEEGIDRMAASISQTFRNLAGLKVRVMLENTAGAGSSLGHNFEYIAAIIERSGLRERLYICLDTCHAFVSGYDIASADGLDQTLAEIDRLIGLDRLPVIHFNDSKFGLGSLRDRHAHIGEGEIGMEGMRRIVRHPALRNKIFILETPKDSPDADALNIARVKSFRITEKNKV